MNAHAKSSLLNSVQTPIVSTGSVLVVLAAIGTTCAMWPTALDGPSAYGFVAAIAGGTAVAGGIALASPSSSTIPHLILLVSVLALTMVLVARGQWSAAEVKGVFGFILGGGTVGVGTGVAQAKARAIRQREAELARRPPLATVEDLAARGLPPE